MSRENEISKEIVDAAMTVHTELGAGLLESAYEACLCAEMIDRGLNIARQVPIPVVYKNKKLDIGFRLDILVEELVIIEVKAVDTLAPVHTAQAMTYLKLAGKKLCLLLNFNVPHMKQGIKRVVMNL